MREPNQTWCIEISDAHEQAKDPTRNKTRDANKTKEVSGTWFSPIAARALAHGTNSGRKETEEADEAAAAGSVCERQKRMANEMRE